MPAQALVGRLHRRHGGQFTEQITELDIHRLQLKMAGFDLREIQDVVDDRQQMPAGAINALHVLPLFIAQGGRQQQFGHAEHAIHRGPDFVAHHRQKLALGAATGLCRLLGLTQFAGAQFNALFEVGKMTGEPVVTLADLADHVIEARRQLVEFMDAATESLHIVSPDRHLGHVAGQCL